MTDAGRHETAIGSSDAMAAGFGPVGGEADHRADPGLDMTRVEAPNPADEPAADRSHNRETLSSEAMSEMLRDLQDSLAAAEARVSGLETGHGRLSSEARDLALGVAALGDTLSRRVRALESGAPARVDPGAAMIASAAPVAPAPPARPAPRKPEPVLRWTLILAVALALIVAGFWLLGGETAERAAPPPRPAKPIAIVQAARPGPTLAAARASASLARGGTLPAATHPRRLADSADETDTR